MAGTDTTAEGRSARGRVTEDTAEASRPTEEGQAAQARDHVCNVAFCPIGLALSTMQGAAPDVIEHLLKAAQEFLLAARAVIDNRAKDLQGGPDDGGLKRIEIS
jgi:hypothetical protein